MLEAWAGFIAGVWRPVSSKEFNHLSWPDLLCEIQKFNKFFYVLLCNILLQSWDAMLFKVMAFK